MPIPVRDIPTLSSLWRQKKLEAFHDLEITGEGDIQASMPPPSQDHNDRIALIKCDITNLAVDAIVNAANRTLLGGGGVDGAIHAAAGPDLVDECRTLGGCAPGFAKITGAYNLPCDKIIHAVGPRYSGATTAKVQKSHETLVSCYASSLKVAVENGCKSIAFSAISTGIYGYPSDDAAYAAIGAVYNFLRGSHGDKLEKIVFVVFTDQDTAAYNHWLPFYFPPTPKDLGKVDDSEIGHPRKTVAQSMKATDDNDDLKNNIGQSSNSSATEDTNDMVPKEGLDEVKADGETNTDESEAADAENNTGSESVSPIPMVRPSQELTHTAELDDGPEPKRQRME